MRKFKFIVLLLFLVLLFSSEKLKADEVFENKINMASEESTIFQAQFYLVYGM